LHLKDWKTYDCSEGAVGSTGAGSSTTFFSKGLPSGANLTNPLVSFLGAFFFTTFATSFLDAVVSKDDTTDSTALWINMPKYRHATPIFKIQLNKIKAFRGTFLKVRKTGKIVSNLSGE